MKYIKLLAGVLIAVIVTVFILIAQPAIAAREYRQSIENERIDIDRFMSLSSESPLLPADKADFAGLDYFPADVAFRATAHLTMFASQEIIEVPTSAGTYDRYSRFGELNFSLGQENFSLEVWKQLSGAVSNRLFVAFTDLTNGSDTYGGGRYLNLYLDENNNVTIDFNLAYNPYCVYNPAYICPLAPPANRLEIEITAGEKSFKSNSK
ncbi:MAG: DUF1684 domain-containing protein [Spirochaetales bacterium]|jgi:uncharacterized protein|nr:DUF1684 domain-containing protein [Spirochaetales bacterium]